ncbi:GntR family transcriptional regulator [Cohnella hashimotonis]|uniref:GntR family transcriptional regulator n=1 Tax=Cohnella hashimotonis TaxID=2826895 RepID=A0ABT6TE79_9BACL|nr:GntR family transcriptional regulator [Cohnella hashimotonis]MDI4645141.1 GntR family transcriptional regulator [Cohnella hashimotonis]
MKDQPLTLKEKAYLELRKLILSGRFKPGDVLTERLLVEMLSMSRTPIRAAYERLDAEGLANYVPNKGLTVAEFSLNRALDLFDYRIAIEGFVARKLAQMEWASVDLAWFEANLAEQETFMNEADYERFTEADSSFHAKLAEVYGNKEITMAMNQLQDKLFATGLSVLRKDRNRIQVSYQDHLRIFSAIRDGDASFAGSCMEEHLEYGKRILIR